MIRFFYAPETARFTRPNIGKDGGNPVKRVLSALLVLMLVLGFYPRPALDLVEQPADVTVSTQHASEGSAS